jgi:hypothetical protein
VICFSWQHEEKEILRKEFGTTQLTEKAGIYDSERLGSGSCN